MNPELIIKFKDVFDWWLEDWKHREVMSKTSFDDKWYTGNIWHMNPEEVEHIIPKDQWVDIRIAFAEGKEIEYKTKGDQFYSSLKNERDGYNTIDDLVERYSSDPWFSIRVKPEAPEWVKHITENKPIICDTLDGIRGIIRYENGVYFDESGCEFDQATPVKAIDMLDFQRKEYVKIDNVIYMLNNSESLEYLVNWFEEFKEQRISNESANM